MSEDFFIFELLETLNYKSKKIKKSQTKEKKLIFYHLVLFSGMNLLLLNGSTKLPNAI